MSYFNQTNKNIKLDSAALKMNTSTGGLSLVDVKRLESSENENDCKTTPAFNKKMKLKLDDGTFSSKGSPHQSTGAKDTNRGFLDSIDNPKEEQKDRKPSRLRKFFNNFVGEKVQGSPVKFERKS